MTDVILTGLGFGESPRWHYGRLWLCNWGRSEVIAVEPGGVAEVVTRVPTQIPFSIDWLPDGRLLVVCGREGLLLRQEPDGSLVPHADLSALSDRGWNEIVVDGRGNAYLNGIGYDMMAGEPPTTGLIALVTADGSVRQVGGGVSFPNGMAVTPDNGTLIVAESHGQCLSAFEIEPGGGLGPRRVWAPLGEDAPDGICIDAEGAVWYASVPGKHCVRVAEGGEVLDRVALDRGAFACMLGGLDARTLYIVAAEWNGPAGMSGPPTGQLLSTPAPAPGAGWPAR